MSLSIMTMKIQDPPILLKHLISLLDITNLIYLLTFIFLQNKTNSHPIFPELKSGNIIGRKSKPLQ